MRNKMNRCCCDESGGGDPVTIERFETLTAVFTGVDYHDAPYFTLNIAVVTPNIMKGLRFPTSDDPYYLLTPNRGTYGAGFNLPVGGVPQNIATATAQFWGTSRRFDGFDQPASGFGAPSQSIKICVFEFPEALSFYTSPIVYSGYEVPRHVIEEGVSWTLERDPDGDWLDGTLITTPDIAAAINRVTSSPTWNPLTSRVGICFYVAYQNPDQGDGLSNPGAWGARYFQYLPDPPPDPPQLIYTLP